MDHRDHDKAKPEVPQGIAERPKERRIPGTFEEKKRSGSCENRTRIKKSPAGEIIQYKAARKSLIRELISFLQIRAAGKRVGSGLVHHRLTADAAVHEAVKHRAGAEAHCAMHAAR